MSRFKSFSRRSAEDLLRDEEGHPKLTEPYLKQLCKEMRQYTTPRLNDQLYLHFKGFAKIEALEEYTGLRCLWLEGNGLRKIEGLEAATELRGLYCQQNCIEKIENIEHLKELDAINVSNNMIGTISGLTGNEKLGTLTISHNKLKTADSIRGVLECPSLRILDFAHNNIEDPAVLDVFAAMENLKVLNLMGNKCIKLIPQYRKTFIIRCKDLTYLDDRPVFPKERAQAEAFFNGFEGFPPGREAEREARQAWIRKDKERQNAGIRHLMQIQARAKAHAKAGTDGGDPDRSDSEEEGDNNDAIDNAPESNAEGYGEWQQGEKYQPSLFDQRSGKIPDNANALTAPGPIQEEPIEVITGPKAADIDLFDSEDEFDVLEEEEEDAGPAITEVSTTRTAAAAAAAPGGWEAKSAPKSEELADEVPVLERVDIATGTVIGTVGGGGAIIEEMEEVKPVVTAAPAAAPAAVQAPRKMMIEEVSSSEDDDEEIPEEIISTRSKPKWHAVETDGAKPGKKPLIEMIGGDDMDGLD